MLSSLTHIYHQKATCEVIKDFASDGAQCHSEDFLFFIFYFYLWVYCFRRGSVLGAAEHTPSHINHIEEAGLLYEWRFKKD
jgi:hypothetical protein